MRRALLMLGGVTALGMIAVAVHAQAAPVTVQSASGPYSGLIAEAAQRFSIPATWIRAIIRIESRGDSRAVSPKGAMGLMQLMPQTWAALRARYRLGHDPFDPHDNILAGAAFLREMYDRYGSPGFLAAYNAGPARYENYRDSHRPLPPETRAYVAQFLPLLGGHGRAASILATASDPVAWARAPIFVVRSVRAQSVDQAPSKQRSNGAPIVVAMRDLPVITLQSDGLFVHVSRARPKS